MPEEDDAARRYYESLLAEVEVELAEMEAMFPDWNLEEQMHADKARLRGEARHMELTRQVRGCENCAAEWQGSGSQLVQTDRGVLGMGDVDVGEPEVAVSDGRGSMTQDQWDQDDWSGSVEGSRQGLGTVGDSPNTVTDIFELLNNQENYVHYGAQDIQGATEELTAGEYLLAVTEKFSRRVDL